MDRQAPDSDATAQLIHELAREVRAVSDHGLATIALSVVTAVLLLWILRVALRGIGRVSTHFGVDRGRRFARVARVLQLLAVLAVGGQLVQSAARIAPVWVAFLVVFVVAPMALWASGVVHDLVGGAFAQLRLRLTEGDYVRIGEARGVLTRVGVLHFDLRDESGTVHRIPNRRLTAAVVQLGEQRRAVPVLVELATRRPLSQEEAERLGDSAATSPFRAPGTRVSVERLAAPDRVRVHFFVWSQRATAPARKRLERTLAKLAPTPCE